MPHQSTPLLFLRSSYRFLIHHPKHYDLYQNFISHPADMPKRIQFHLHKHLHKIPVLLQLDSSPQHLLLAVDLKCASITFHLKSTLLIIELESVAINATLSLEAARPANCSRFRSWGRLRGPVVQLHAVSNFNKIGQSKAEFSRFYHFQCGRHPPFSISYEVNINNLQSQKANFLLTRQIWCIYIYWIVRFCWNLMLCAIAWRIPGVGLIIKTENNWQVVRLQVTMQR